MVKRQDWSTFALQRPNYFAGQYLLDEDFELAHKYLSDRQQYINCRLHLAGIVEGLEVEVVSGETAVTIKSGTALDGEGHLIILPEAKTNIKIVSNCWVCLRYHQEPKVLQQEEIPDSFTRFVESPLITLEAIETKDEKTITLARLTLDNGFVQIDASVREYSGVRLPSGKSEEISLRSDGQSLAIKGNLSVTGQLYLSDRSAISAVSEQIDLQSDRTTVAPSEKAVKQHIDQRIVARLAELEEPEEEPSTISVSKRSDGKLYGWKTEGGESADSTSLIKLISYSADLQSPRLTIERDTGKIGIGTTTPSRTLEVIGSVKAQHLESANPMRYLMYPDDPIVYQDIFEARAIPEQDWPTRGGIVRYRTFKYPVSDAETRHSTDATRWYGQRMICYGSGDEDDAGALITLPQGYDTLWVRLACDRFQIIRAQCIEGAKEDLGRWTAGKRSSNSYCPDGSLSDADPAHLQWLPIPIGRSGQVTLVAKTGIREHEFWISGLGFSKNPWAHATQSALGYHRAVNTGVVIPWDKDNWNNDILAKIEANTNAELMVPYVWSGRDKLLYIVEHNSDWNGCTHAVVTVNDQPIERLIATYNNPFSRHWNSKSSQRYIAARIPAALIPKPRPDTPPVLRVRIDMRKQDAGLYFREIGTHDLEVPEYS